ncbi:glucokinase [Georgenia soli]|uniref:Glucokinase n=1 Tax=Georgenia soli TaxID=638953 RepID=A0A2A9ELT4_9MICO|nr:ROK family protein [Georgenia soli]PFG39481.1 glucokinase [Georgenia soli]
MSEHLPQAVVALDVGGTAVKSLVVDRDGVLHRASTPTRASDGPEQSFAVVLQAVEAALAAVPPTHTAVGVGLAVPGTVDENRGVCVHSENLGWTDLPVRDLVAARTGLPVGFGHDVRAGGLAEWRLGAGRGAEDLAYLSVGTGIAAALVLGGRPVVAGGYVGEVGHGGTTDGDPCACGGRGCPETFASAAAIGRRYTRLTGTPVDGARGVLDRTLQGDRTAELVWAEAVDGLGVLVSDIVRVTGASRVVVGGGLVHAGDALLDPLREHVRRRLTVHRLPEIVPAVLGGTAGAWGSVLLGWRAAGRGDAATVERYAELHRARVTS